MSLPYEGTLLHLPYIGLAPHLFEDTPRPSTASALHRLCTPSPLRSIASALHHLPPHAHTEYALIWPPTHTNALRYLLEAGIARRGSLALEASSAGM